LKHIIDVKQTRQSKSVPEENTRVLDSLFASTKTCVATYTKYNSY